MARVWKRWTKAEDEIITAAAGSGQGAEGAQEKLPHRPLQSIRQRACFLGVKFGRTKPRKSRPRRAQPMRPPPGEADPRLRLEAICRDPELLGRYLQDITARATATWLLAVERLLDAGDVRALPALMALGPATARLSTSVMQVADSAALAGPPAAEEVVSAVSADVDLDAFKIRAA